jgi:hypothetical protein
MKPHYKEYNFTDWINLSEDLKRDIQVIIGLPLNKIGEKHNLILDAFIRSIGETSIYAIWIFCSLCSGINSYRMIQERKC